LDILALTQIIVNFILIAFKQRIQDQAKQNMNSLINVCERLKFFREIHKSGERPPYIDICRLKSDRSLLSKFRISAHSLAIEKGRYPNIETRGGSRGGAPLKLEKI
jgi:hypothetical protein